MTQTVWKFNLRYGTQEVTMPANAKILSVGWQPGGLVMWAQVPHAGYQFDYDSPIAPLEERSFLVINTGDEFGTFYWKFVGTVQDPNGLVRHVFVKKG